jgi:hypothetical protein
MNVEGPTSSTHSTSGDAQTQRPACTLCRLAILITFEEAINLFFERMFLSKNAIAVVQDESIQPI